MSMTERREPRERSDRPANRNHTLPATPTITAINPCPLTTTPPFGRRTDDADRARPARVAGLESPRCDRPGLTERWFSPRANATLWWLCGAFWSGPPLAVGYARAVSENPRIERGWIFVNGSRRDDGTIELGTGDEIRFNPGSSDRHLAEEGLER